MSQGASPVRAWLNLGLGRVLAISIDVVTTAYLMRLLGPEPFGIMAMTAALLAFFGAVGDVGVGASLVSDPDLGRSRVGAATAVTALLSLAVTTVIVVSTPGVVAFYGDSRVGAVWLVLGLLTPIAALQNVPRSLAQRAERFALLAWAPVVVATISSVVGIIVASHHQDHWALIARQGTQGVLGTVVLWSWVRPALGRPTRADLAELGRFGRGVLGFDLLNVLNRNADKVIVGRVLGDNAVGLYGLAYRILSLPLGNLGGIVSTVAYPRLVRRMPDTSAVASELSEIMRSLSWVAAPLCVGAAVAAPELVTVLVGTGWLEAVLPFRILALLGAYQTPFAQLGHAYMVTRRTQLMARWGALATPFIVGSFALGLPWGITGVAMSYAAVSLLLAAPMVGSAARALNCRGWQLARGGVLGLLEGVLLSLPIVAACVGARSLSIQPAGVLGATILIGVLVEGGVLLKVRRRWGAE